MNCTDMMQIAELEDVLKLKAGEKGLWHLVRWIYFADCLQCIKSEYKIENYIHGGEFVILTNRGVTDDSAKLMTLIRQMWEYGIAALGINEGQISEELLKYCEKKELPLFELPEKFPLIDLSQIMCRRLVLEENDRNAAEQLFSSILDAEHLSRERVMAQIKCNLAPLGDSIVFRINGDEPVTWLRKSRITAEQLVEDDASFTTKEQRAETIIYHLLKDGAKASSLVLLECEKNGISVRTAKNAKAKMNITTTKRKDGWYWELDDVAEE